MSSIGPSATVDRTAGAPTLEQTWAESFPELSHPVTPVRPADPRLLALNEEIARDLRLDPAYLASADGIRFLTGESVPGGPSPVAQVYAGHQWGVFQPVLGDGRAALLGERRDGGGRLRDVHLKGIGPTPLSRIDGYAVVGPMLREFLMGEALHALGIPTTRMLAVVATGRGRELDGVVLPGAVLARTASCHVRFGSFEYVRAHGDVALLRRLADHVIERHHPQAAGARHPYRALLQEVVAAVAALTADWMRVGFVHGVLSTDNVLVAAETVDFGPCAFLDAYEPGASFSSIDRFGRYAYDKQPSIMKWNLQRLGEALVPLLADEKAVGEAVASEIVDGFDAQYRRRWAEAFRAKLGLPAEIGSAGVAALADGALALLAEHSVDFTGFWRDLATAAEGDERAVRDRFLGPVPELDAWLVRWRGLAPDAGTMLAVNPHYIARNHIVEEALHQATEGDLVPFQQLVELLCDPYTERPGSEYRRFARPAPAGSPPHRTVCGT